MRQGDKTIAILDTAMGEFQKLEFKFRKDGRIKEADGVYAARRILSDMHTDYVEQKSRTRLLWRLRVWRGFYKARKAIRKVEL